MNVCSDVSGREERTKETESIENESEIWLYFREVPLNGVCVLMAPSGRDMSFFVRLALRCLGYVGTLPVDWV